MKHIPNLQVALDHSDLQERLKQLFPLVMKWMLSRQVPFVCFKLVANW